MYIKSTYTSKEVMELLSLSRWQLYDKVKNNLIPHYRDNKKHLKFPKKEIDKLVVWKKEEDNIRTVISKHLENAPINHQDKKTGNIIITPDYKIGIIVGNEILKLEDVATVEHFISELENLKEILVVHELIKESILT